MIILRYLWRLISNVVSIASWATGLIAYTASSISTTIVIPSWVYWLCAIIGFVGGNFWIYYQQERKINEYEDKDGIKLLEVLDMTLTPVSREKEMLQENGVPYQSALYFELLAKNLAIETAELFCLISIRHSKIPYPFFFYKNINVHMGTRVGKLEGEKADKLYWQVDVDMHSLDPMKFAQRVGKLPKSKVRLIYWTVYPNRKTKHQSIDLTVNCKWYTETILSYWTKGKRKDLVEAAGFHYIDPKELKEPRERSNYNIILQEVLKRKPKEE